MQARAFLLAAALVLAPLGARAADLVVWWDKGFNPEEDQAVAELAAAFGQRTGRRVEVTFHPQQELPAKVVAALEAGRPPDFAFGLQLQDYVAEWASEGRLADLADAYGALTGLFDPDALDRVTLLDPRTGRKALHALPVGRASLHLHVWKSLLERAGFTLQDIPKEWEAFWSFWCDTVQPAVRKAMGRDDVWAVGLPMSAEAGDTRNHLVQFLAVYGADYVTRDGRLVVDDPEVRRRLARAVGSYTAIHRKGCTPPDATDWSDSGNNRAFLGQRVVMTPNTTLSIPNALRRERPDDYFRNVATIEWPLGPHGERFPIYGSILPGVVFEAGGNVTAAKEFVSFLVGEGWLGHWLNFAGDRLLPPMRALAEQPFWLDPGDPHRMAAVMQVGTRRLAHDYGAALAAGSGGWRHALVEREAVWSRAIERILSEGITPEQAVDEASARTRQLLSE